ncbi:MAG: hypothetical protein ACE365_02450 [Gammaproteobacteria bacterium]
MKTVTLAIPELLSGLDPRDRVALDSASFPMFETLMSKATKFKTEISGFEPLLRMAFSLPPHLPLPAARITGKRDGLPVDQEYWMRADPVHIQTDQTSAYLMGNDTLDIDDEEQTALVSDLNEWLVQDGLTLIPGQQKRWYLKSEKPFGISTHYYYDCLGKSIGHCLPRGEQKNRWRSLLTELQMVLFRHPVNEARKAKGIPEINSLWFWGEGNVPHAVHSDYSYIVSDDPVLQGLAEIGKIPWQKLEDGWQVPMEDNAYVLLTPKLFCSKLDFIRTLEQEWFSPLFARLEQSEISRIVIYPDNCLRYEIVTSDRYKPWRRKKRITALIDDDETQKPEFPAFLNRVFRNKSKTHEEN